MTNRRTTTAERVVPASARTILATASHEIRAPVHTILGMSELLAQTTLTASQRQYLDALRRAASSLATLLDDILDLSKIGQQGQQMREERFWLPDLSNRVVEVVQARAEAKGLALRVTMSDRLPKSLLGDLVRLQQVLVNLVVNAIKYTDHGEVRLDIDGEATGLVANVRFTVKDTGPGIPADRLHGIFDAWSRLPQHGHIEGLGLGLAISRRLVDAMHGTIEVESQTDAPSGSMFRVTVSLPIAQTTQSSSTSVAVRSLRFLVVGAPAIHADIIGALAAWTPRVDFAVDEGEGERLFHLALGKNEPYHVVVIDADLPHAGAVGFGATLLGRTITLVVLEPRALADVGNLVEEIGATPVLFPLTTATVYAALERSLALREERSVLPEDFSGLAGAVVHVADDDTDARTLLLAFLDGTGLEVHAHQTAASLLAAVSAAPDSVGLVLCDVEMRGGSTVGRVGQVGQALDGAPDLLRALRADARCADLPVVALTAHSDEQTLARLRSLGFAEVMAKPFSRSALVQLVRRHRRTVAPAVPEPSPNELQLEARMALARRDHRALELLAKKLPSPFARALTAAAKKKDDAAVREVLRNFDSARRVPVVISTVDDAVRELMPDYLRRRAQDVRDIADAVATGRFDSVAFIGHRMSGTGSTFGLPQLSELGGKLEIAGKKRDAGAVGTLLRALQDLLAALPPSAANAEGDDKAGPAADTSRTNT